MAPKHDQVIVDLSESICDLIDTYVTGHDIALASIVGVLHCIAHDLIAEMLEDEADDEDDELDGMET